MIRKLVFAAVGAATVMAGPVLLAGPAFAGVNTDSPPMPYTAPDPVYAPHKVVSTVDMIQPKDTVTLTGNNPPPGTVAPQSRGRSRRSKGQASAVYARRACRRTRSDVIAGEAGLDDAAAL